MFAESTREAESLQRNVDNMSHSPLMRWFQSLTHATSYSRRGEVAAIRPLNLFLSAFLHKFQTPSCCEGVCNSLFSHRLNESVGWVERKVGGQGWKTRETQTVAKQTSWEKQMAVLPEADSTGCFCFSVEERRFVSTVNACLLKEGFY